MPKIFVTIGENLEHAVDFVRYTRRDKHIQETIRELLLSHPLVIAAAEREGIDLSRDEVTKRGGYDRVKKKANNAAEP